MLTCKKHNYSKKRTAAHVPPEVLNSSPATFGNDLWALGCTLYQMLSGTSPSKNFLGRCCDEAKIWRPSLGPKSCPDFEVIRSYWPLTGLEQFRSGTQNPQPSCYKSFTASEKNLEATLCGENPRASSRRRLDEDFSEGEAGEFDSLSFDVNFVLLSSLHDSLVFDIRYEAFCVCNWGKEEIGFGVGRDFGFLKEMR
ncbi:hypothetical protein KIW84_058435 [Lathyrus oleraceus]|uniref:Protein kinase domain-containing protein n=1 Tax=Pisum sativum TaxID=3888 RepID=A0A9D4X3X7_PEA|nr:hypothetical protein KIW84_058435 [Pisum sativum]